MTGTLRTMLSDPVLRSVIRVKHIRGRTPEVVVRPPGEDDERKLDLRLSPEDRIECVRFGEHIAREIACRAAEVQGLRFDSVTNDGTTWWFREETS